MQQLLSVDATFYQLSGSS